MAGCPQLHYNKVHPANPRRVTNFDKDLADGVVLCALLRSHVPTIKACAKVDPPRVPASSAAAGTCVKHVCEENMYVENISVENMCENLCVRKICLWKIFHSCLLIVRAYVFDPIFPPT